MPTICGWKSVVSLDEVADADQKVMRKIKARCMGIESWVPD